MAVEKSGTYSETVEYREGTMNLRLKILLVLAAIPLLIFTTAHAQDSKFRLKPDAKGKLCLGCHPNFEEKLKSKFVHTPVQGGECSECHNPHTSRHGKLLDADANKVCLKCHEAVIPDKAKSVHKVSREGQCVKCHDPHASGNKANLVKVGNDLCFSCHKTMGETLGKAKFKHSPVEGGCLTCHEPHASAKADHLLKNELVALCGECHKADSSAFVKAHANYPMAKTNCSSCHDPHGSNRAGILFDNVHGPVASKGCIQCHEAPTSASPFKTKRAGYELCRGCHSAMMNDTFNKNRVHWPLLDKEGCLSCHEAHASTQKKLLTTNVVGLCAKCHSDTMEKREKYAEMEKKERAAIAASKGKVQDKGSFAHSPVSDGNCLACHAPHASNSVFLMTNPSQVELCGTCHEWLKHSSHPIGDKIIDSRNKNLTMQCLSCHRSHGTGYRNLNPFPTVTDLCVQCHQKFKR
jgi:DmsE family decaheme c-type cytochrome